MEDDVSWRNVCSNGGPFGGLGLVGQGGWPIVRDIFCQNLAQVLILQPEFGPKSSESSPD